MLRCLIISKPQLKDLMIKHQLKELGVQFTIKLSELSLKTAWDSQQTSDITLFQTFQRIHWLMVLTNSKVPKLAIMHLSTQNVTSQWLVSFNMFTEIKEVPWRLIIHNVSMLNRLNTCNLKLQNLNKMEKELKLTELSKKTLMPSLSLFLTNQNLPKMMLNLMEIL
jgi:hypothetical protein